MTTEEKLQHFYEVSMESARDESEKALEEYRAALSQMLADQKHFHNASVSFLYQNIRQPLSQFT